MKLTDDYRAKIRLWAAKPVVIPLPFTTPLPRFAAQRFKTHAEMNAWKQGLLREIATAVAQHG